MKKILTLLAALFALSTAAMATDPCVAPQAPTLITRGGSANLVNNPRLSCGGIYPMSLGSLSAVAAQATYSSATLAAKTFGDGTSSSGSASILDYTKLVPATATNQLTVVSTSGIANAQIRWSGHAIQNGVDWKSTNSVNTTASSIAAAMVRQGLNASASGAVITITAPKPGTYYNSITFGTNKPSALSFAHSTFVGGQNAATFQLSGTVLLEGRDFMASTSNGSTASSLADAINESPALSAAFSADVVDSYDIDITSNYTGEATNAKLAISPSSGWTSSGSRLTGGTNSAYALGGTTINIPNNHFGLGAALLYTQSTSPVIGGLTDGTTYYAAPLPSNPNLIRLADTAAHAGSGTYITFTSSSTQSTADTYTLTPLDISGNPGFKWIVSNDGTNWIDLQVSSITIPTDSGPTTTAWDFGSIGLGYLGVSVASPDSGAVNLKIQINGR